MTSASCSTWMAGRPRDAASRRTLHSDHETGTRSRGVAFVVCQSVGLQTGTASADYKYSSRSCVDNDGRSGMPVHDVRNICVQISGVKREAKEDNGSCKAAEHGKLYRSNEITRSCPVYQERQLRGLITENGSALACCPRR